MNYFNENNVEWNSVFKEENMDRWCAFPSIMSGRMFHLSRKNLKRYSKVSELNELGKGIYILRGRDATGKCKWYVGKASEGSIYRRLYAHQSDDKRWWEEALCAIDLCKTLGSGGVGFLESKLIKSAKKAKMNLSDDYIQCNTPESGYNIIAGEEFWFETFLKNIYIIISSIERFKKLFYYEFLPSKQLTSFEKITNFISQWANDPLRIDQYRRRNGWTFRPSHGDLDQDKLIELQEFLTMMFYQKDKFVIDLNSIDAIRKEFDRYPKKVKCKTRSDKLFIRQQKNYMEKLQLIKKLNSRTDDYTYVLTDKGRQYINAVPEDLEQFLMVALEYYKWFDVNVRDFARKTLLCLGTSYVSEDEFLLFLSHGGIHDYGIYRPSDIAELILMYRNDMTDHDYDYFKSYTKDIVGENDNSKSHTSFQRISKAQLKECMDDILGHDLFKDHSALKRKYKDENPYNDINKLFCGMYN